ncbi:type II toxin-antitoxin system VapC family toxin [uncultured Sphingomonas sp.]|uniref:type II toxin-antitoxin system VapC family toxin n=1 Tax=uncultured Sphingomonas sp. TaxID=158754 RepID=UPI0035CAF86C
MTICSFDSNILIDSLNGLEVAKAELEAAASRWISRVSWIEVMSKVRPEDGRLMEGFFADFTIDEVTVPISRHAAVLRLRRPALKLADAVILASAQVHDRVLVTRNTKDFPPGMAGVRIPYSLP